MYIYPKFPIFFKNRLKIGDIIIFCARCLLKASKSLSRAVPEPSRGPPEPSRAYLETPKRSARAWFAELSALLALNSSRP